MAESFDAYQYLDHLRSRWRLFLVAAAGALALAITFSLLQPKQYTAATRVVIEPPAGMDPRAAIAFSPIYLDSLRTYEHFAASDSLFQNALDRFNLRKESSGRTIEAWKSRVLRVEIPRSTKILEIRVTLPDAKQAHQMALYIANETVKLSQSVAVEGDQQLTQTFEIELTKASEDRDRLRAAFLALTQAQPVEALEAASQSLRARRFAVERDLLDAETLAAELAEREKIDADAAIKRDAQLARSRVLHLTAERKSLEAEIARVTSLVSTRTVQLEQARARLKSAETASDAIEAKLRDARGMTGQRGDRLRLIDPGVQPERHSSPNVPLNGIVALLVALLASLLWVSFEFGSQRRGGPTFALPLRVAGRRSDG
jgi:uncharacterized protein involved in exopolysaccharide biosynthesis